MSELAEAAFAIAAPFTGAATDPVAPAKARQAKARIPSAIRFIGVLPLSFYRFLATALVMEL
jgi:hypothetical protein